MRLSWGMAAITCVAVLGCEQVIGGIPDVTLKGTGGAGQPTSVGAAGGHQGGATSTAGAGGVGGQGMGGQGGGIEPGCGDGKVAPGEVCFGTDYETYGTKGVTSQSLAAVDCDDDGDLDLVVAHKGSTVVDLSVLLNDGDGAFEPLAVKTIDLARTNAVSLIARDVVGTDSHADLLVGHVNATSGMTLLQGMGSCEFQLHESVDTGDVADLAWFDYGDDGGLDAVAITKEGADSISAWFSDFATPSLDLSLTLDNPNPVAFAFDETNRRLFYAGTNNGDKVYGRSDNYAEVNTVAELGANVAPKDMVIGDFGGDGLLDLATANTGANGDNVTLIERVAEDVIVTGAAISVAVEGVEDPPAEQPEVLFAADVDADGILDIVTANYANNGGDDSSVSLLLNRGNFDLEVARQLKFVDDGKVISNDLPRAVARQPVDVVVADLNGDGAVDIVTVSDYNNGMLGETFVSVLLANP